MTADQDAAWAAIAWWHRVRPTHRLDYFRVPAGPLGAAMVQATNPTVTVPMHVQDARTLLGFPRTYPARGEATR